MIEQDDDECIHGQLPSTCSICRSPKKVIRETGSWGGTERILDSPEAIEHYRARYSPERQPTFDAYKYVFFHLQGARDFPGGWTMFSRCASAEAALTESHPELIQRAEELMRQAGYELDDSGRPGKGRKWFKVGV